MKKHDSIYGFLKGDFDQVIRLERQEESIWICMDAKEGEESISRIKYIQEAVYGKPVELANIDKPQGVIIRIKNGKSIDKTQNQLIDMLEELIRDEDAETKKRNLSEDYGIVISEKLEGQVNTMCNWSEAIAEREMEKGIEKGIEKKTRDVVCSMLSLGKYTKEDIAIVADISVEDVKKIERENAMTNDN